MGILNITPDSFSDGGLFLDPENAVKQAKQMMSEGADILDLGAESSRPGSKTISAEEELERLLTPLEAIAEALPDTPLSVDTYKASVADAALQRGTALINDIWGLQHDPEMANVIAQHEAGVVIMHNQTGTDYPGDIMAAISEFFEKSLSLAQAAGIAPDKIILDPGIGFGKTTAQCLEVLARMGELKTLCYPLLLGTSRKSIIGNTLNLPVDQRLEATIATNVYGQLHGAAILRVHDVKANLLAARMTSAILEATTQHG